MVFKHDHLEVSRRQQNLTFSSRIEEEDPATEETVKAQPPVRQE